MKLKKSKRLAQIQINKILSQTKELVDGLDNTYDNKQLEQKLKEIKSSSSELIDFFIENCAEQSSKIKDMNKRNYQKRESYEEVIQNVDKENS